MSYVNEPIVLLGVTGLFGIIGWSFKILFAKFAEIDRRVYTNRDKIAQLEFSAVEILNTKVTLSNFGSRLGELEAGDAVLNSNFEQIKAALNDEKAERQQSSQIMIDILTKLGELTTQMAVIATKLENIDSRLTRLEAKAQ